MFNLLILFLFIVVVPMYDRKVLTHGIVSISEKSPTP